MKSPKKTLSHTMNRKIINLFNDKIKENLKQIQTPLIIHLIFQLIFIKHFQETIKI